ncbi:ATP-binding protein, partial [Parabacteroides distasonis]
QSNRMISLVRDISSLNRMDEVLHSLSLQLTDIAAIVHDIELEVALQLEQKRMTITNTLDTTLPIMGDQSMIYSIFRNLIDNSIAYSGEGTAIVIRCREERDMYHFRLSDNGTGIPAEHLPHIFERFYRIDKGRNRKIGGTGLGLAIVKNAVMLHGGTISAAPVAGGG